MAIEVLKEVEIWTLVVCLLETTWYVEIKQIWRHKVQMLYLSSSRTEK